MFVVKGTSLIPSHQYSVQRFLQSFLFYPYSISTPPSSFSFQSYFLFFNSFILHFYTSTAVDTCSLRLPIFFFYQCLNFRVFLLLSKINWSQFFVSFPSWRLPRNIIVESLSFVLDCFLRINKSKGKTKKGVNLFFQKTTTTRTTL